MRHQTLGRGGALLTAAALALSLGTGPANAASTTIDSAAPALEQRPNARLATGADLHAASVGTANRLAEASPSDVTSIKASSALLGDPDENLIDVDVFLSDEANVESVTLNLSVGGKTTGPLDIYVDDIGTFVVVPGTVGLDKAKFISSTITYTEESGLEPTVDRTKSNLFYVRRYIDSKDPALSIEYTSKTKWFSVHGVKIFTPSTGTYTALSSIKLQYKVGSTWKTKKTIKLSKYGNGSYKLKTSKKYRYRIYSAVTSTSGGLYTLQSSKL